MNDINIINGPIPAYKLQSHLVWSLEEINLQS